MYGLKDETIVNIQNVFSSFPEVERAILYGSRAKGNFKQSSDIDITIIGIDMNLNVLNQIEWQLDDLLLPYTFDISIFHHIKNVDLIEHIERIGVLFYEKKQK